MHIPTVSRYFCTIFRHGIFTFYSPNRKLNKIQKNELSEPQSCLGDHFQTTFALKGNRVQEWRGKCRPTGGINSTKWRGKRRPTGGIDSIVA